MCESAMTYSGGFDLFCMIAQGDYQFWLSRENQWKGPQGPKDGFLIQWSFFRNSLPNPEAQQNPSLNFKHVATSQARSIQILFAGLFFGMGFWMSWLVGKLVHDDADDKGYTDILY